MRKLFLSFVLILFAINSYSQSTESKNEINKADSTIISSIEDLNFKLCELERYKLYPTDNMYTFLKLDTATGKIEQVQWSLERKEEGTFSLNNSDLSYVPITGTFELYPTKNMYQFILLDKFSGRHWHVQWGLSPSKRWIRRIF